MRNLQESKLITGAGLNDMHLMREEARATARSMKKSFEAADMLFVYHMCRQIIEENYDLGRVVSVEEVFGGYMSRSFRIWMEKGGVKKKWFFRRYVKNKDLTELKLEHKLLIWAKEHGNNLVSVPIRTAAGKTYVRHDFTSSKGVLEIAYFAVYEYLEGADSYTWLDNELEPQTSKSIAVAMATLHNSTRDFDPGPLVPADPPIFEFLHKIPDKFVKYSAAYANNDLCNQYTRYFDDHLDYYREVVEKILVRLTPEVQAQFPVCSIQGDFHPGNFKYDEQGLVCGVFDFDWASIDHRAFEIGLGMVYTFASWQDGMDGHLYLTQMVDWLREYDKALRRMKGLPPLTAAEKEYMPELLLLGWIYLVRWCSKAVYLDMELNQFEYLSYLRHMTAGLAWVEKNEELIRKRVTKI